MQEAIKTGEASGKKHNFTLYSGLVLFLSIAIGLFWTMDQYSQYMAKSEERDTLEMKAKSLRSELDVLNNKEKELDKDENTKRAVRQYASKYMENQILDQIYRKIDGILVHEISMTAGQKLSNGLSLANISISVDARNINFLNDYINYLTSDKNEVRFKINTLSFPLKTENPDTSVTASIGL